MNFRSPIDMFAASTYSIGGINVANFSEAQATARIRTHVLGGRHVKLAFCNAHVVNVAAERPEFKDCLQEFLVLPDGVGVDLACRYLYGTPFAANLNGTDFIPALLQSIDRPLVVALLGAKPGVAERAAGRLAGRFPQHRFEVAGHGYQSEPELHVSLARLEASRPDILLVALGNPWQELFIARRITDRHAIVAAGVGALFDFLAGDVPRAPTIIRKARAEWIFRLLVEPRRLWKRYILGNATFVARLLSSREAG